MSMRNPSHPGELIRESIQAKGWTVAQCAERLGVTRNTLSRLLNGHAGVSPTMALALERIGWSDAEHWVRMQGSFELAQARLRENGGVSPRCCINRFGTSACLRWARVPA